MLREITTGERPSVTSFVGASAAPSHAPAVRPQSIPTLCSVRRRPGSIARLSAPEGFAGTALTRSTSEPEVLRPALRPAPRNARRAKRAPASYSCPVGVVDRSLILLAL